MRKINRVFRWFLIPPVLVMSGIFYLSSIPGTRLSLDLFPNADKVAHLIVYGILALSFAFSLVPFQWKTKGFKMVLFVVLVSTGFGVTDELHQFFVPDRSVSVADLSADMIGSFLAVFLFYKTRLWERFSKPD